MKNHIPYMRQCIDLGKKAMLQGDPPIGALVVKENNRDISNQSLRQN